MSDIRTLGEFIVEKQNDFSHASGFIANLQPGYEFRVLLLFLLLRSNEKKIESGKHQNHHDDEAGAVALCRALRVSVLNKEIHEMSPKNSAVLWHKGSSWGRE